MSYITYTDTSKKVSQILQLSNYSKVAVLCDDNTYKYCYPLVKDVLGEHRLIVVSPSDKNKNLYNTEHIWNMLEQEGATRHSVLINLGGGMITDLGGFAASTFKRGIDFINIPTSLLAMVDASVGGKTGINYNGLKNEIGVFSQAKNVNIDVKFLDTLDKQNLKSGYAEMLKHAIISGKWMLEQHLSFDFNDIDEEKLTNMIRSSVDLKLNIVDEDELEAGPRKKLNLGHTIGHAIEEYAMSIGQPMLHGYAVAYGLVAELHIARNCLGLHDETLKDVTKFVAKNYADYDVPSIISTMGAREKLLELMKHDKKNLSDDSIVMSLPLDAGDVRIVGGIEEDAIMRALFYLSMKMHSRVKML